MVHSMTSLTPPWYGGLLYFHGPMSPGSDMLHTAGELRHARLPVVAVRYSENRLPRDREILTQLTGSARDVLDNPRVEELVDAVRCRL